MESIELVARNPHMKYARPVEAVFPGIVKETDPGNGSVSISDDWRETLYDFKLTKNARIVKAKEPKTLLKLSSLKKEMKVDLHVKDGLVEKIEIKAVQTK